MGDLGALLDVLSSEYVDFEVDSVQYPLKISLKKTGRGYHLNGVFMNNDSIKGIIVVDGRPKIYFWTDTYPEYLKGECEAKNGYIWGRALETDTIDEYMESKVNGLHRELENNHERVKEISIRPTKKSYDF